MRSQRELRDELDMDSSWKGKELPWVSVVVLNYNGDPVVYYCVDSLLKSNYPNLEIIIIDNASTDRSYDKLKEKFGAHNNIIFHQNERNEGYPSYNRGAHLSRGDYIVFLNNDTEVHPDWLKEIVDVMESDLTIGACESKIVDKFIPNTVINPGPCDFCGIQNRTMEKDVGQYSEVREIFSTIGVASTLRRSVLRVTGMLDPEFFLFEEINDLCWRIWLAGYRVVYVPKSIIIHIGRIGHAPTYYPFELKVLSAYQSTKNHTLMLLKNYSLKNLVKCFMVLYVLRMGEFFFLLMKNHRIAVAKLNAYKWLLLNFRGIWTSRLRVQKNVRCVSEAEIERHLTNPNFSILLHRYSALVRSYKDSSYDK